MCETILPASLQLNKCQSVNKKIDNLKALALHPNRQKCNAYRTWMGYFINENKSLAQRASIFMLSYSRRSPRYSLSRDTRVKPNVVTNVLNCTICMGVFVRHVSVCVCERKRPLLIESHWTWKKVHRRHGALLDKYTWSLFDSVHHAFAHKTWTHT